MPGTPIDQMMMVNHFSTFQLTMSLLPLLKKTSEELDTDVRIVTEFGCMTPACRLTWWNSRDILGPIAVVFYRLYVCTGILAIDKIDHITHSDILLHLRLAARCRFALPPVPTGIHFSYFGQRSLLSLVNPDAFLTFLISRHSRILIRISVKTNFLIFPNIAVRNRRNSKRSQVTGASDETTSTVSKSGFSKLAILLAMTVLQKKLATTSITVISVHPGYVDTFSDRRSLPRIAKLLIGFFVASPDVGAYNSTFAAASPLIKADPKKYKGAYLNPVGVLKEPGANARREDLQEECYAMTEKYLASLGP
ncbi:uncharacterized protein LACBIDRAFT_328241 [Laccaria bicolor S238N-H82]|uniref:Predicted protein n=1 Tax=Laccaria bicolor (strain S238N-H82 / ATCC MYA-4686) TaxID=486041 RepID=B0DEA8_LACBS|nr:uncharacterized protein LACBIDRAFT_328241 [Laccaria bicolor S238N-H82]EDR07004.1 predicted protein [Laccaria bicolor S238N-H82]|eukprot:XP_001882377.1 predicted protein [Laccaria bicolor S238N-H82]